MRGAQNGSGVVDPDAPASALLSAELANARERIDELGAKAGWLQAERDNWMRQADADQRLLLDARAKVRSASGISPGEFLLNLVAMLAFPGAVAVLSVLKV